MNLVKRLVKKVIKKLILWPLTTIISKVYSTPLDKKNTYDEKTLEEILVNGDVNERKINRSVYVLGKLGCQIKSNFFTNKLNQVQ